jgi:hypothetical protein
MTAAHPFGGGRELLVLLCYLRLTYDVDLVIQLEADNNRTAFGPHSGRWPAWASVPAFP